MKFIRGVKVVWKMCANRLNKRLLSGKFTCLPRILKNDSKNIYLPLQTSGLTLQPTYKD